MRKKLLVIIVLLGLFSFFSMVGGLSLNASGYVSIKEETSIRYKTENSKQGLRFYAKLDEAVVNNEHGFYLVYGDASLNEIKNKVYNNNLIHNDKEIFKVVVPGVDANNNFSVVLTDIPEHGYMHKITAISYVVVDGQTHFSNGLTTTSVMDVAVKAESSGEAHSACMEIVSKLDKYKVLVKDINNNYVLTNNFNTNNVSNDELYYDGDVLKLRSINSRLGYNGYYLIGNKRYYQGDNYIVSSNDDEFKVLYQPVDYLVSFYVDEIKVRELDDLYNIEQEYVLPTLDQEGFVGWYNNPYFSGSVITKINKGSTGPKDFYAKFSESSGEMTDTEKVNFAKDNLDISYSGSDTYYSVTRNVSLTSYGLYNTNITWSSSNNSVLSSSGVVNRGSSDISVTLTATISLNNITEYKTFYLTIKKEDVVVNEYTITYLNLKDGVINFNDHTYKDNETVILYDPILPGGFNYIFVGWYTSLTGGYKVSSIDYGSNGNKTFYARWEDVPIIPDTEYTITFNLNGGSWPTESTGGSGYTNRDVMITDFLTDFYNFLKPAGISLNDFMHGAGKTSGFDGLYNNYVEDLREVNVKTVNPGTGKFVNQETYNKWVPLIDLMDEYTGINPEQAGQFWSSNYVAGIRFKPFILKQNLWGSNGESAGYLDICNKIPAALASGGGTPTQIDVPTKYKSTSNTITLPVPNKTGESFLGWYYNTNYQGSPITSIPKGSTGNKTFYARWTSTVVVLTDREKIDAAKNNLNINYGSGDSASSVTKNITLITKGLHDVNITWSSSNTTAITNTGIVTRSTSDINVTLTATLKIGSLTETKTFSVTIKKEVAAPTTYTINYVLDGGSMSGYKNKTEVLTAFFNDLYTFIQPSENLQTFIHGAGKTSGFDGLWYSNETYRSKIYGINIKTGNNNYFLSHSSYQAKWKPLADFMVAFVKINPDQDFWGSASTGTLRLKQYATNVKPSNAWSDEDMARIPTGLSSSAYYEYDINTPTITLPNVTKLGFEFLGWYTASSGGTKVTSIPKGSTGNKTFYARWKALVDPVGQTMIKGPARISLAQAEAWARSKSSNALFLEIIKYYFEYGELVGIRPEVLIAQMAHETGYCSFQGAVKSWQFNFAGIKKRYNNGDTTNDFEAFGTAKNGVRGHTNHMAAYVGLTPYGDPHGRYYAVLTTAHAGKVTYVEGLTGTWAMDPAYATRVRSMLNELLNFKM